MSETKTPHVYEAWAGVCEDMARGGIGKNKKAPDIVGGYAFRGIDDVLLALSASFVERKMAVRSAFVDHEIHLREKRDGKIERHARAACDFYLHSLVDGSSVGPFRFLGEAADSNDKATNKIMSIAYKYFAIQTFAIPVRGVLADEEPNVPDGTDPKPSPARKMITGPHAGVAFCDATFQQLNAYGVYCEVALKDPAKAKHRATIQSEIDACHEALDAIERR